MDCVCVNLTLIQDPHSFKGVTRLVTQTQRRSELMMIVVHFE